MKLTIVRWLASKNPEMKMNALQVFAELSEAESIRQVARAHGVAASVISRQIESVEYFFGVDLFDRSVDGIKLTESGKLLLEHVRSILADVRNAKAIIDDLRGLERGEVLIKASGALAIGLMAPIVAALHREHPNLRFEITLGSGTETLEAVADGTADLGLSMFSPPSTKVHFLLRQPIKHFVIVASGHRLAGESSLSLEQLAGISLALPDPQFSARQKLDEIAAAAGVELNPTFTTSSLAMQKELALDAEVALVLPLICVRREIEAGSLKALPLENGDALDTTVDLTVAPGRRLPFAAKRLSHALQLALGRL